MSGRMRRVFLVDDHALVREWLINFIESQGDMEVCGEADEGPKALRSLVAARPDAVVLDISLKGSSGLDLIRAIKVEHPKLPIVVLSMHDEKLYAERVIRAGARGYVMKRESTEKIIEALREVMAGKLYVSDEVAELFSQKFLSAGDSLEISPLERLSDRELEIFALLGQGYPTRGVAERCQLSMKSVQSCSARIREKLNLGSTAELLREAMHWNESHA